MSLVGVRDIIGTTRENSSIYAACVLKLRKLLITADVFTSDIV